MTEVDRLSNENMHVSANFSPYRDNPPGKTLSDKTEDNRMNVNKTHVDETKGGKPTRGRRRRVRKRRYGPYNKNRQFNNKTSRNNQDRFTHGHAVAPYNTTQFLMDEHKGEYESDLELNKTGQGQHVLPAQFLDSEGHVNLAYYSSPDDEELFLEKEFSQEYRTYRAERLSNMPKQELIQEYLQLEDRIESLENKLTRVQEREKELAEDSDDEVREGEVRMDPETAEKIRIIQEEFNRLLEENQKLQQEILRLRTNSPCVSAQHSAANSSDSDSYDSDSSSGSSSSCSSCSTCSSDSDSDSNDGSNSEESQEEPSPDSPSPE